MSSPSKVNIYDFDDTIYKGDGMIDFYLFCVMRMPTLIRYMPFQLWHILRFALKIEDRTTVKRNFFVYLKSVPDVPRSVDLFWDRHYDKGIKQWYTNIDHSRDVIITASPYFLVYPAFKKLNAHTLIATDMNERTGEIKGKNCYGQEKLVRFKKEFPDATVEEAYGDRASDTYVMALAKKQYLVRGDVVELITN